MQKQLISHNDVVKDNLSLLDESYEVMSKHAREGWGLGNYIPRYLPLVCPIAMVPFLSNLFLFD